MIKRVYLRLVLFILFFLSISYFLSFHGSISKVNTNESIIFLTFDDGPSENTIQILKILENKNISATFFLVGDNVKKYPDIIKQLKKTKHNIGIHSMTHSYLYKNVSNELNRSKTLLESEFNKDIYLFRPPYGFSTPYLMYKSKEFDLKVILWDVFPRDYEKKSFEIISHINNSLEKGSIIVLHDSLGNKKEKINLLSNIIDLIERKGYKFALLEDYIT